MESSIDMNEELKKLKAHKDATFQLDAKEAVSSACEPENKLTCETIVETNEIESDIEGEPKYGTVDNSQQLMDQLNKLKIMLEQDSTKVSSSNTSSGGSSSVSLAPKWIYGTTLPPLNASRNNYSSASGLCLSERGQVAVAQPELIQNFLFPTTTLLQQKIVKYRESIGNILSADIISKKGAFKNPLLVITGPSFITDANQAKACAQWVGSMNGKEFHDLPNGILPDSILGLYHRSDRPKLNNIQLSLRTNLTKYNHGYNDPSFLRGFNSIMTYEIEQGIPICRALLCELAEICPIVGETSDTITPQYFSDLFCLGIVSSKLSESQLHRELVSGVSYAVGFHTLDDTLCFDKEFYTHKITSALEAMYASSNPHQFLSVTKIGTVAVVGTIGNDETFIILLINLELDYYEIEHVIEQVYDYSKLNITRPKIMLDVGKISNEEYELKLDLLRQLLVLNTDLKYKIIGVIIDSGNNYISHRYTIDLNKPFGLNEDFENQDYNTDDDIERNTNDNDKSENSMNHQMLIGLNNYFVKNRIHGKISPPRQSQQISSSELDFDSSLIHLDKYYEYFVNADKFIQELDDMSSLRINSQ